MKKCFMGLLCLAVIMLMMPACSEDKLPISDTESTISATASTQKSTVGKEPIDILTDAGLSQELINVYFTMTEEAGIQITADEFVELAFLTTEQMWEYVASYAEEYSVGEYVQFIDKMKNSGLTDKQIDDYARLKEDYSLEEYTKAIKDMINAGLTEDQVNMYAFYYAEYKINPDTYIFVCTSFENVDDIMNNYNFFCEKYSLEEFCNLITELRSATREISAMPVYLLSDTLVFVKRNISTYDRVEESIAILTLDGKIVADWNVEWGDYDIQYRAKCGDYFFIIKDYIYNYYVCDVVNKEGKIIANVQCLEKRYDIGDGYVFYSMGADFGQIMNPQGDVIELQTASVWPSYCEKSTGYLAEGDSIGKISEGLFYGLSIGNNNTAAYYYNTEGEVVIDLSTKAVNFKITKLYDFSEGRAKIEFTGADYKEYYAYIDKTGAFIGEPIEIKK